MLRLSPFLPCHLSSRWVSCPHVRYSGSPGDPSQGAPGPEGVGVTCACTQDSSGGQGQASACAPHGGSPGLCVARLSSSCSVYAPLSRKILTTRVSLNWWRSLRRPCSTLTPWSWMILALACPSLTSTCPPWTTRILRSTSQSQPC